MHTHTYMTREVSPHTQELWIHTYTCSCMYSIIASCFAFWAKAEPHQLWCHWWGHCLGHQQHSDAPLRAAGNYEVMDQHTLAPTHTCTPHLFAAPAGSWVILQSFPSAGAAAAWENFTPCSRCKFGWGARWKSTTDPNLDSPLDQTTRTQWFPDTNRCLLSTVKSVYRSLFPAGITPVRVQTLSLVCYIAIAKTYI